MITFDPAFKYLMSDEDSTLSGVITAEPDGSRARYGINSARHPNVNLETLTPAQAEAIFEAEYWTPFRFDLLESQQLASKVFNTGGNIGPESAIMMLQRVLSVSAYGHIGENTVAGLDRLLRRQGRLQGMSTILHDFCAAQAAHYKAEAAIAAKAGRTYPLEGLLARAARLP